ncbi:uncharacterized protein LOC129000469 [Macrosteles quadrilineatus]|uniref:uncharacterized protein LOC129000469 n=1 Tax=Macrosteles quadrilineatus TaxID=74068 RepID=UPI0023E1EDAE|nr:uncharacterized protein LOC129000469 [Macrosteles quadrilineatus]
MSPHWTTKLPGLGDAALSRPDSTLKVGFLYDNLPLDLLAQEIGTEALLISDQTLHSEPRFWFPDSENAATCWASISSAYSNLLNNLDAVLDFGIRKGITDLNFILGVSIAKAQLEILEKHVHEKHLQHIQPTVEALCKKCENLIDRAKDNKEPLTLALDSKLWNVSTCPGCQLSPPPSPSLHLAKQDLALNPQLSDECISLLLTLCLSPPRCVIAELSDNATNYLITHQVLYWIIFNQKCTTKLVNSTVTEQILKHKCSMTFQEHHNLEEKNLPPEFRDLYFEQTVVCGILGFTEFMGDNMKMITSLQHVKGCFTKYTHRERPHRKCDLHFSGVATGVLALIIKHQYD